jgi:hypothetical protein
VYRAYAYLLPGMRDGHHPEDGGGGAGLDMKTEMRWSVITRENASTFVETSGGSLDAREENDEIAGELSVPTRLGIK